MKLNNQQISALADRIYTQISDKINAENKVLINDNTKFVKWTKDNKKYVEALFAMVENAKILEALGEDSYYSRNYSSMDVDSLLKEKFKKSLDLKDTPYIGTIKQDIILENIECENLKSIITKLVDKYTK